jgi:hypothetical protein
MHHVFPSLIIGHGIMIIEVNFNFNLIPIIFLILILEILVDSVLSGLMHSMYDM